MGDGSGQRRPILIAFIVYLVLSTVVVTVAPGMRDSGLRMLVGLVPSLGMAFIILVIMRWLRNADEYHRARLLESFAVTAAVTVFWTSSYSYLEMIGLPRLNSFWIPVVMMITWFVWSIGRAIIGR